VKIKQRPVVVEKKRGFARAVARARAKQSPVVAEESVITRALARRAAKQEK
jgi:hypothetical protein